MTDETEDDPTAADTDTSEPVDDLRPDHPSDRVKVPAEDREATLVSPSDHESGD